MSRKEIKRELEAAYEAIEAADADLAAGRIGAEEHERRRAEREREVGRLFVSLRRAQREAAQREAEERPPGPPPAQAEPRFRSSMVMVAGAVALALIGVGAGVLLGRRDAGTSAPRVASAPSTAPGTAPSTAPGGELGTVMPEIELQALRTEAARDDAPIPVVLQFAHAALDRGRLDEARRAYERVLAREPRNAEAIDHVGAVLYQEGRIDEALGRVEEALRIEPGYIHALWDRTQYLFSAKRDYPAAVKAAEAFLKVVPDGPDAEKIRTLMAEARRQPGKTR